MVYKAIRAIKRKFIDSVNQNITHPRDDEGDYGIRYVMHIPLGFVLGLMIFNDKAIVQVTLSYQRSEDRWTKDESWKDIGGILCGYVIGRLTAIALIIYLVLRWIK